MRVSPCMLRAFKRLKYPETSKGSNGGGSDGVGDVGGEDEAGVELEEDATVQVGSSLGVLGAVFCATDVPNRAESILESTVPVKRERYAHDWSLRFSLDGLRPSLVGRQGIISPSLSRAKVEANDLHCATVDVGEYCPSLNLTREIYEQTRRAATRT